MEKITIKNTTIGTVGIRVPEIRLNREIKEGASIKVDKELFEEALTYPGVKELIDDGDIAVLEEDARLDFGLQFEKGEIGSEELADTKEIAEILTNGTLFQLKKLCEGASDSRKNTIAKIAFTCKGLTMEKIEALTKYSGVDIMAGIKNTQLTSND